MVTGIDSFKEWFKGSEEQYAIIGGTACDILMTEEGLDFRATKDIDLVLIIEAVDANFGKKFWEYVKRAGYEHCNKSSGVPQFYRFSHPISNQYPAMIELFTRKLDAIQLPEDAVLTPLPIDEDISSLSAILLDDDYYEFLKQGKVTVDGVTVLDAAYLIPFKAKAWMDLIDRKAAGEHVDSKNIKKHNYIICDGGIHHLKYHGQTMAMQIPEMEILNVSTESRPYCICGSLCTVADVLVREVELPVVSRNDVILFHRCGAYSVTEGSALFLSRKMPEVYLYNEATGLEKMRSFVDAADINRKE